jgi:4-amino-4-deoxy-L-arabinose transferase-like glycosyltransferase/cytochrome c-type biogenesis protein CcmH/NrfG
METIPDKTSQDHSSRFLERNAAPIFVFSASLVIRLIYLLELHFKSPFSNYLYLDALRYDSWAQSMAFGFKQIIEPTFRAPFYPIFLATIYRIFGHDLFFTRLVQMLLGSLVCVMVYFLALKIFNKRTAIISSLMAALYGPFLYWSGEILIVNLIVFLDLAALLMLFRAFDKPKNLYWLIGGVVLGLSAIARPNVLIFIPWVVLIILLMNRLKKEKVIKKQRVVYTLYFLVGVLLAVLPVTTKNYFAADDFVLISSQGGINFYMGNNQDADGKTPQPPGRIQTRGEFMDDAWMASVVLAEEATGQTLKPSLVSRFWYMEGLKFIFQKPVDWFKLMSKKLAYFWTGVEVTNNEDTYYFTRFSKVLGLLMWQKGIAFPFGIICPLAVVGIIFSHKRWRRLFLLYGFIFFYMVSVVLYFVCARYRLPVIPVLLIFAGYTINYWYDKLKLRQYKVFVYFLVAAILIGVMANVGVGKVTDRNRARAHLYGGQAYEAFQNYQSAIDEYESAIKLVPDHLEANHGLGIVYMKMHQYGPAETVFRKTIEIDPYLAPAYFNLGSVLVGQKRYCEALDQYEAALRIDPDYELTATWAAMMYEELDQWEEALKKWEMVLQINPNNEQARSKVEQAKQKIEDKVNDF